MANTESTQGSNDETIRQSEAAIRKMEEDLGLLEALEQDRRAARLRLEIADAWEAHKALVRNTDANKRGT